MSELGDFLKAKRAAVTPESVGLPAVGRPRRVAGLRREEVARLADVSVDHYTRLEQGRTTGASEAVLDGIARALRLDAAERAYLLLLAKPTRRRRAAPASATAVNPAIRLMLDELTASPALVLGPRLDIVAWNRMATGLFLDFAALPETQRNLVRLIFLEPRVRSLYTAWEQIAIEAVARLRMAAVARPEDERLVRLVNELSTRDDDFRRWWSGHEVRAVDAGRKSFAHPLAGPMTLDWQALVVNAAPDQTLVVYTAPPDSSEGEALRFLSSWSAAGEVRSRPG